MLEGSIKKTLFYLFVNGQNSHRKQGNIMEEVQVLCSPALGASLNTPDRVIL